MARSSFMEAAKNAYGKAGRKAANLGRMTRANIKAKMNPSAEQRNRNAFRDAGRRVANEPQMAEKIAGGMNRWKKRRQDSIDSAGW